jgi:hypothetical protein
MANRIFLPLFVALSLPQLLFARLSDHWTEKEAFEKADLVVIGMAVSTRDTNERSVLSDMTPNVKVAGVETEFEVCLTVKGLKDVKKFRLHHYREQGESTNGPMLVNIPHGKHSPYLLFLVREKDGRYAPATGQTDPAVCSVLDLQRATGTPGAPVAPCQSNRPRSFHEMLGKADLVVIGEWTATKDTDEHATLSNGKRALEVLGVNTEVEVALVLKGQDVRSLILHHYRAQFDDAATPQEAFQLIRILPPERRDGFDYPGGGRFLLFLTTEPDGRYAPATGQADPAVYSVLKLVPAVN